MSFKFLFFILKEIREESYILLKLIKPVLNGPKKE